jgi:hypothetical protein
MLKTNKRILRTGALAVAMTIVFAIFAFRAAEWTRGLDSEFIVYGQNSGGSTGTGGTGGSGSSLVKVVAQIASGNYGRDGDPEPRSYGTVMELVNPGTTAVTVSGNFYNENGTAAAAVPFASNASNLTITNGSFSNYSLPAGAILVISTGTSAQSSPAAGTTAWGKFTSSAPISVTSFFELRHSVTRQLFARVGVPASRADLSTFVIARVREKQTADGLRAGLADIDTGFALVNTGAATAHVIVTAKDANGNNVGPSELIDLEPNKHIANFAGFLFTRFTETAGQGRQYQYLKFEATPATVGAAGLSIEGASLSSFPVDPIQ